MENNLDCGLLPSFARSCTEISREFFMSGVPPFIHAIAERLTPSCPTYRKHSKKDHSFHPLGETTYGGKIWKKIRPFTE